MIWHSSEVTFGQDLDAKGSPKKINNMKGGYKEKTDSKKTGNKAVRMRKNLIDDSNPAIGITSGAIHNEKIRIHNEKETRKKDLTRQIELRAKFLDQRQKELDALNRAFAHLNDLELAKEQQTDTESRVKARREMFTYKKYLEELKQARKEEEQQIQEILIADQNEILGKQDEAKCKIKAAKEKLRKEVYSIRARQLEEKKENKEKEKAEEKCVAEFMNKVIEMNHNLDEEAERLRKEEVLQYRDDLCKQIEYNRILKEREGKELEREQKMSEQEEQRYLDIVNKMVQEKIEGGSKHPFREVLDEFECYCREQGATLCQN